MWVLRLVLSLLAVVQISLQSTLMGICPTTCVRMSRRWIALRLPWPTVVSVLCLPKGWRPRSRLL